MKSLLLATLTIFTVPSAKADLTSSSRELGGSTYTCYVKGWRAEDNFFRNCLDIEEARAWAKNRATVFCRLDRPKKNAWCRAHGLVREGT